MRLRPLPLLAVLLSALAWAEEAPSRLKAYDAQGGVGKKLFVVPVEGTIDLGVAAFVERVTAEAKEGDVVILEMKTFGGRLDAAVRIRDALLNLKAKTVSFIDGEAASAGALIALATDTIVMTPGAAIGAATPVQMDESGEAHPTSEKVVSYMRELMRATAEAKGRRGDLAAAMVDSDVEVPGVNPKGKVLTLTTQRALELKIADASADSLDATIALLNLERAERVDTTAHWGERLARFLTDPVVSSLLMSIGVLGIMLEFYTAGHGIGGAVGIICLGLFFFGQYAVHLAGMEELLIFVAGFVLLLLEIFVIPGFGIAGIAGIALMGVAVVMALVELHLPWDISYELGYFQQAVQAASYRLFAALIALIVGAYVFSKYLPRTRIGRDLILETANTSSGGFVAPVEHDLGALRGKVGRAVSMLRPAGIADFEGQRVDVVSDGEFIDAGTEVVVQLVDGNRVVVKKHNPQGEA